ncbi:recQ-mediated genome instability protein 1 [Brienomyrus brachyistius]|uniref:recQ-mediated genome instability protein 1 n=1 Tax=Brienomyrus brachyistius TaxID=42636 RepID=UPI0020B18BB4|nr:recQ-mediated genome instability protein 1 [Brienomyrus brachyistius]XP_048845680.1 recQ-mediated genome instability protein 1 [Brienomyrus brachyistius]
MDTLSMVQRAQMWLKSTWHIQVPFSWLEACVDWIQGESRSSRLSQNEVNQQVLEQWLFTDLRDLSYPTLPDRVSVALKTEVSGFYCLQMDSVLDISQPAYSQLQQWRGKECSNDTVSADTQATQRAWELKPTRMLLLQLTDGVQILEGMEYQPIPFLNVNLRPGTKILLQGTVACRLGVLLLKPGNMKVIGGEVENLLEQNSQGNVLCRSLHLPGERPQENAEQGVEPRRAEETLSDEELLAGLEEHQMSVEVTAESGYSSRSRASSGTGHVPSSSHLGVSSVEGSVSGTTVESAADYPQVELLDEDFDIPFEEFDEPFSDNIFAASTGQTFINHVSATASTYTSDMPTDRAGEQSNTFTENAFVDCMPHTVDVGLDSPPFTYLSVLQADKTPGVKVVRVKAFIITLLGSLRKSTGKWQVRVTISDGSHYLDADLSDCVLASLIGFSVAQSKALKKDPEQRRKVTAGLQYCQKELVDMCCIMTLEYDSVTAKAEVIRVEEASSQDSRALENRVKNRMKS